MGALHAGHVSLIEQAKAECDVVVVSIYVNALQFNSETDFTRYPRTEATDFHICTLANVDAVFAPVKHELFPEDEVELLTPSRNALGYEGADRPGHFAGVVTVVDRLFNLVQPSVAYFGLKDYQQVAVINDMASHARLGRRTARNEIMYAAGGVAYVYLCYGIHHLFKHIGGCIRIQPGFDHSIETDPVCFLFVLA